MALATCLLVPFVPGAAHAEPTYTGRTCSYDAATAKKTHHTYAGEVEAGPLALAGDDPTGAPLAGSITCTIQEWPNITYADPALVTVTSDTTERVVLPPTPVTYHSSGNEGLCTRLDVVGHDPLYLSIEGEWSADPNTLCWYPLGGPPPPEWGDAYRSVKCLVLHTAFPDGNYPVGRCAG